MVLLPAGIVSKSNTERALILNVGRVIDQSWNVRSDLAYTPPPGLMLDTQMAKSYVSIYKLNIKYLLSVGDGFFVIFMPFHN